MRDTYTKDVVVHSTLVDPYITERASVAAYAYYAMTAWSLSTDLSDGALDGLESGAIQALIGKAQKEVEKKSEEVFGKDGETGAEHTIEYYKGVREAHTRTVTKHTRDGDEYEVLETY